MSVAFRKSLNFFAWNQKAFIIWPLFLSPTLSLSPSPLFLLSHTNFFRISEHSGISLALWSFVDLSLNSNLPSLHCKLLSLFLIIIQVGSSIHLCQKQLPPGTLSTLCNVLSYPLSYNIVTYDFLAFPHTVSCFLLDSKILKGRDFVFHNSLCSI